MTRKIRTSESLEEKPIGINVFLKTFGKLFSISLGKIADKWSGDLGGNLNNSVLASCQRGSLGMLRII